MRNALRDFRHTCRLLLRSPGFMLTAALTLALGIGANTAIFSVVYAVLLKPLPYREPDALIRVFEESPPETPEFPVSPAAFLHYRSNSRAFEALAAYERADLQLGGDRPEQLRGMRVTAGFFGLLGYRPQLGREFTREDEGPGRSDVAILSHSLWRRRFAADPGVLGRTVILSGRRVEIVGVLPPGVQHVGGSYRSYPHGESVELWWPRTLPAAPQRRDRAQHYLNVIGRLRPGLTPAQAREDVRRMAAQLTAQFPDTNARWSAHVRPLRAEIVAGSEAPLLALLVTACVVLLIGCLNVGGLLLGRGTARTREIAVRTALGATRGALVRQLAIESGVLAAAGGALGIAIAYAGVRGLLAFAPADLPRLHMVSVDRVVLAYTLAATALTALVFGLAPAIQLTRVEAAPALSGGRGAPTGRQQRLRSAIVVAEIALAFALVVTGALLARSFSALLRLDPGFRPNGALTAAIDLPRARYGDEGAAAAFFERALARVRALPGVTAAGFSSDLPWTGYDENTSFGIPGHHFPEGQSPEARYHFITPGFVRALGLPLRAGRDITAADRAGSAPVVLINEATARRFWGEPRNAIGARLDLWGETATSVVGVIGELKDAPWDVVAPGGVYFPQAQQWYSQPMYLTIRTDSDPATLINPLREVIRQLDPELPLASVRTLEDVAGAALAARRFTLLLVGAFSVSALFLAVVGVYGVMAQAVAQRVREFGVRQALGARPADILRLVLSGGLLMAATGLGAGLALALPATHFARALFFRASPTDPLTLGFVAVLLTAAVLAASYVPARRATRIDPSAALRLE